MGDNREFGALMYDLSQRLTDEEINGIILIEDLPNHLSGEKLKVLIQLQMNGRISQSDPSTLQEVFKGINRMDLVDRVKQFIKSQKKKGKKQKLGDFSGREEKMLNDLMANLKVSLIQTQVLRDQLINVANVANKCGEKTIAFPVQESIRSLHNEVERTIINAQKQLETSKDSYSSSESSSPNGSPESTLNRHPHPQTIAAELRHHFPTQEENREEDEGVYEIISHEPRTPFVASASSPIDDGQYYPMADLIPPKQPEASSTPKSTLLGNAMTIPMLDMTAAGGHAFSNSRKKTNKPLPPPKPVPYKPQAEKEDKSDYSGADFTGTGSDSGFSESWNYLGRPIALPRHTGKNREGAASAKPRPTPAPRHPSKSNTGYTPLNVDEVKLSYYKTTARELNQKLQDVMSKDCPETDTKDEESLYQNIYST